MDGGGERSSSNARVGGLGSLGLATFFAQTAVTLPDLSLEMWRIFEKKVHFKFNLAIMNIIPTQR